MLGSETTTREILKGLQQSLLRNIDYKYFAGTNSPYDIIDFYYMVIKKQ